VLAKCGVSLVVKWMVDITTILNEHYWIISCVINKKFSFSHANQYRAVCVVLYIKNDHLIIFQPQHVVRTKYISLMERQFVVTHAIRQTEIPPLLDSWVTNTPPAKMLCPQKYCLSVYFRKNITCFSVGFSLFLSPGKLCIGGLRQIAAS
jgi:hypothetical protein